MSTHTIHSWATMMARRLRMCAIMLYFCMYIHRKRMRPRRRMRRAHTSAHDKNNMIAVGTNKYNDVAHATTCANVHTQRLRRLQDTHATTYTVTNTNTHIQHHDSAKNKKPTATLSNANENDNTNTATNTYTYTNYNTNTQTTTKTLIRLVHMLRIRRLLRLRIARVRMRSTHIKTHPNTHHTTELIDK